VAIKLKGFIESKPQLAGKDRERLAFFLFHTKTYNCISCVSSIRFGTSAKWKLGDQVVLFGKWEHAQVVGHPIPLFIFNSVVRQAA
jgi:hypothetical protein